MCTCFETRKMMESQAEPMFPSLFDEIAIDSCKFFHEPIVTRLPPRRVLKWMCDGCLCLKLMFFEVRAFSPTDHRIASAPPLLRTRVSERVCDLG